MIKYKFAPNTDTVDISQKCLGISPTNDAIPSDVRDYIHSDRGLHIQIRHNGNKQAVEQAKAISRIICAAPEMLEALQNILEAYVHENGGYDDITDMVQTAIRKARGGK
jgi:hypothetical protein